MKDVVFNAMNQNTAVSPLTQAVSQKWCFVIFVQLDPRNWQMAFCYSLDVCNLWLLFSLCLQCIHTTQAFLDMDMVLYIPDWKCGSDHQYLYEWIYKNGFCMSGWRKDTQGVKDRKAKPLWTYGRKIRAKWYLMFRGKTSFNYIYIGEGERVELK